MILMIEWNDFNEISDRFSPYLSDHGEGDNMATQTVTAITKLVYKWFNDGDVYDNNYYLEGWWNDLSSEANWLYNKINCKELGKISEIRSGQEYTELLYNISNSFTDEFLKELETKPKNGSIYEEDGPFSFADFEEYDEDEIEY